MKLIKYVRLDENRVDSSILAEANDQSDIDDATLIKLLQRKIRGYERYDKEYRNDAAATILNSTRAGVAVDPRDVGPDAFQAIIAYNGSGHKRLFNDWLAHPNDFYTFYFTPKQLGVPDRTNPGQLYGSYTTKYDIPPGSRRLMIVDKDWAKKQGLDELDVKSWVEYMNANLYATYKIASLQRQLALANKRNTEAEAVRLMKVTASNQAPGAGSGPSTIRISAHRTLPNPYYDTTNTNHYSGPLSGVKFKSATLHKQLQAFVIALAANNVHLMNIDYATTPSGGDAFYISADVPNVFLYSDGVVQPVLGIRTRAGYAYTYTWKTIYRATDPQFMANEIASHIAYVSNR